MHSGMVSALNVIKSGGDEFLLTGGSDNVVKMCKI